MEAHGSAEVTLSPVTRLASAYRSRLWTTFVLELALITLGILIALYIDGKVQDREDRKTELAYLEVLSRDLGQIDVSLQAFMDFETQNADSGASALRILASDEIGGRAAELRAEMWELSARKTLRLVSAAYTDLVSTGNLQLIRNRALRELLLQYFAEVARIELIIEKNNTVFVDELYFPHLLEKRIAWAPDRPDRVDPELRNASLGMFDLLESGNLVDGNDLFAAPLDGETRAFLRQMIVMRLRVTTIGRILAESLVEKTAELKASLEREIAARG